MPQQPPPQSPQPDQPTPPTSTAESTGASPSQPTGRSNPPAAAPGPRGYLPQPGYGAGPTQAHGRVSTSGGFGQGQPPAAGAPGGWQAPGYGPAVPSPAYPPGTGSAPVPPGRPVGPVHPTQAYAAPAAAAAISGAPTVAAAPEPKKRDLTVNKVIAGAGAAATSAVLGSFFGAMGTVAGAALGSVFSAVATSVMQHSLDKTRDTVKARVKLPGGRTVKVASTTEVPAAGDGSATRVFVTPGDQATEVISAVPAVDAGPPKSRRRLLVMTGFTVVVFAIGMLVITGLELVKGSPLNTSSSSTSQRPGGTSLGSVLGRSNSASTESSTKSTTTSETTSEKPTTEATTSKKSTDENSSAVPGTGFGADQQGSTSTRSTRATPTPSPTPRSGASDQGGQSDGGAAPQPGGGAAPASQE